jgi:endo-1,4-beta-D-glucanase Y
VGRSYRGVGTVILAALGGFAGCSADQASSPSAVGTGGMAGSPSGGGEPGSTGASGGSVGGCTAGETQACSGPDGCTGVQACLPDGTAFGPCDCSGVGSGGQGIGGVVGSGGLGTGGGVVGAGGTGTGGGAIGAGGTGVGGVGTGGAAVGGGTGGAGTGGEVIGAGGTGTGGVVVGAGGTATGGVVVGAGGSETGGNGTGGDGTGATGTGGEGTGGQGTGGGPTEWCGYTSATIQNSLQSEYDSWKSSYFMDCNDGSACINSPTEGRCVSEGIGYGMLLAVNTNDQDAFDKLWAYYSAHTNANGVMDWNTEPCGDAWEFNGASDAELDAAMALIQADARWGGYAADATNLITIIRDFETETCSGRIVLKAGDAWGACDRINPSYFAPGYYRAFAQFVPDQAQHWNDMVVDTYELYDIMQTRMSGLYPDWVNSDGSDNGGQYWWEACRVPWRVATDYAWTCSTDAADSLAALDGWVDSNGGIGGIDRPNNSCFNGGFALTGVSASQAELDSNVTAWLANSQEDTAYYQSTLRVLYMLVAAGQFASIL